jgi:putative membrane protein insertion efficiency factor
MKRLLIASIRLYRNIFSLDHGLIGRFIPLRGRVCVFYPSCSEYAVLAIEKYGVSKGVYRSLKRVLRCHPWQKEHVDFP